MSNIKNINSVSFKPGYLTGTVETNLSTLVGEVLLNQGYVLTSGCCNTTKILQGQVLAYDTASKKFKPTTVAGVGSTTDLTLGTITSTTIPITNTNGTGFNLPLATSTLAGLASPAMFNALAGSTPTSSQIGVGDTYTQYTNGQIEYYINGVLEMTLTPGKLTYPGYLDPEATGYTKTTLARIQAISGSMFLSTIWVDSVTGHLFRGNVDLETLGGSTTASAKASNI